MSSSKLNDPVHGAVAVNDDVYVNVVVDVDGNGIVELVDRELTIGLSRGAGLANCEAF